MFCFSYDERICVNYYWLVGVCKWKVGIEWVFGYLKFFILNLIYVEGVFLEENKLRWVIRYGWENRFWVVWRSIGKWLLIKVYLRILVRIRGYKGN